jgi:2'-5' RNA ligase
MPRLFTGLEIPSHVSSRLSLLKGGIPGARWVEPENYHITLCFIGDIDNLLAREIAFSLDQIDRASFEIIIDGLTILGSEKPRALVAHVQDSLALSQLQSEQERMMRRLGMIPETRKFIPHITLARLKNTAPSDAATFLGARGMFEASKFLASRFVLYSSRNSIGGGPYVVEAAYPLR